MNRRQILQGAVGAGAAALGQKQAAPMPPMGTIAAEEWAQNNARSPASAYPEIHVPAHIAEQVSALEQKINRGFIDNPFGALRSVKPVIKQLWATQVYVNKHKQDEGLRAQIFHILLNAGVPDYRIRWQPHIKKKLLESILG